jgi:hypothetical protein
MSTSFYSQPKAGVDPFLLYSAGSLRLDDAEVDEEDDDIEEPTDEILEEIQEEQLQEGDNDAFTLNTTNESGVVN